MKEKSNIIKHHRFGDFMRLFDKMRTSGQFNYRNLHKEIARIDDGISYDSVYAFFRKFIDTDMAKGVIHRGELREKKKMIADEALDEVVADPKKLPLWLRLRLGKEATDEELKEIGMVLSDKHKKKEEDFMDKLLDEARYGGRIVDAEGEVVEDKEKPYLDRKTEVQALPEADE